MRQKLILIISTIIFSISCYGQKLTLTDLMNICSKKNWESVNTYISSKGWDYYDSKKGDTDNYSTITWSYEKDNYNDKAQAWFYLYTYDGLPNKISYSVFNKISYSIIQNSIAGAGFKSTKSEIEDNLISTTYTNNSYILKVSNQKREDEDYSERSTTAYVFLLIKKAGVYDLDNGNKIEYYDNGQIKADYNLTNGKINGLLKYYHENGVLQRIGNYINDKETGKFNEYNEQGVITADYIMQNGNVNGILTIYKDGFKSQEIAKINGVNNGKFVSYYYDQNNKLQTKYLGNFRNGKKNGKWETYVIEDGKEEIVEYKNYIDDIKNGPFKEFIGSDTLEEAQYENGILNGAYTMSFRTKGYSVTNQSEIYLWSKDCDGQYKNGVKVGKWTFFSNGNKLEEGNYVNGKKEGKWIQYVVVGFEPGAILAENEYVADKINGLTKKYFIIELEPDSINKNDFGLKNSFHFKRTPIIETIKYKNDKKEGEYILKDSTGRVQITGYFLNDLKEKVWNYYFLDKSHYSIEYKNDKKIKANYYNESSELFLIENYFDGNLSECEYYNDSILFEKHLIQNTDNGYKVIVELYSLINNDTISSYSYSLKNKEEYSYQLLEKYGVLEGVYEFKIKKEMIINGLYCNDKKCGRWDYNYSAEGVYAIKNYKDDILVQELFYDLKTKLFYSGKIELFEDNYKTIIKIKKGLRNGKSVYFSQDGTKIREENYNKGIKIEKEKPPIKAWEDSKPIE